MVFVGSYYGFLNVQLRMPQIKNLRCHNGGDHNMCYLKTGEKVFSARMAALSTLQRGFYYR